jgi:Flp pilus assembly protein TadG
MRSRGKIRGDKGASAVELALLLPLLVLLIFGMLEFGLLMYNQQVLTNASREGARAGIVRNATDAQIRTTVSTYCANRMVTFGAQNLPVTHITKEGAGTQFQDDITVRVTFNYQFLVLANLGFGPIELAGQTTMLHE